MATISLASCDDQNFDFDEAHRQNFETNYVKNFEALFGNIPADQSWDFTENAEVTGMPLSITLEDGTTITPNYELSSVSSRAGEYYDVKLKDEWYPIPDATLAWFKKDLEEGKDHTKLGTPFYMYVPEGKFSVTPMYQGQHGMDWNLRIQFIEPNGTTNYAYYSSKTGYTNYIWKNGDLLHYKDSNASNAKWKTLSNHENTLNATKIEGKTLHFENVPTGTVVIFDLYIATGSGNYATTGTHQLSTNKMMLALPLTGDALPTKMPIDYGQNNNMMIMGIEDANGSGSDWDYNDVVFLVNGLIKQNASDETIPVTVTKRYMVEDMGYSDRNSTAVLSGYTDIDFNDIVVDFSKTKATKYYYKNGVLDRTEVVRTDYSAKVRALGGTWDFKLYVGNNVVFQKSAANSYINYNINYTIGGNPINSIEVNHIYNTGYNSDSRGDGIYNTAYLNENSYIGTLINDGIKAWDPETNNIRFEIVEPNNNDKDFISSADQKNVYTIEWPKMGACPKIAAFPENKVWQRERSAVDKSFFSTSATWE